ncbi:bifunctional adenosylcobinamide kinase/adenosylcobinamide-phosphate guanylyltransferase [Arenicella sp. 4NH20-0111]|uniref:bifunctional adenosylcobinamide kinase/adenosylcobinamide-phosphate guanylyltransferase n=1 Tax=Arenicella sp. 4NH20-0111 TaxID=3127648 RepID=UPI00310228B5
MNNEAVTHLVLGGARSGKSRYAETLATELAERTNTDLVYLATATADDHEMKVRISKHQSDRHAGWNLLEEAMEIPDLIASLTNRSTILIDCLTLWVSNCMHQRPTQWHAYQQQLVHHVQSTQHNIVMVSNEVGSGVIPMGTLSREYVDNIGWLHQELAQVCSNVSLITAGLPQVLKSNSHHPKS